MILSFLSKSHHARIAVSSPLLLLTNVAYAGVDWTRYDDAPTLFLGWETSFYFAIAAIVLLGLFVLSLSPDRNSIFFVKRQQEKVTEKIFFVPLE